MSRLIIHIGTHKTATTRLQKVFHRNRDLLERHGLIYPPSPSVDAHHALVGVWNEFMRPTPDYDARAAWADLAARYAGGDKTVFISSEEFCRMNARRVDMAELAALAAPFDEVQLICVLRNQASFLQSVYQQIASSRPPADWPAYFDRVIEIRMADGLTLDYNRFYSHLLTGFSRPQIRLISYDHATRAEGGIIGTWLRELDLPLSPADLVPVRDEDANISAEPLATFTAASLSQPGLLTGTLVGLMQEALRQSFGPDRRSTLFTRDEVARLEEVFAPMNAALSARVALYQPGFAMGPMLGSGAAVWREDLTEEFWITTCRLLERGAA